MPEVQDPRNVRTRSFSQICSYNKNETKQTNRCLDVQSCNTSIKQTAGAALTYLDFVLLCLYFLQLSEGEGKLGGTLARVRVQERRHKPPSYLQTSTYIILSQFHHSCCPHQRIPATARRPLRTQTHTQLNN